MFLFACLDLTVHGQCSIAFLLFWLLTSHQFIQSEFLNKRQRIVHGQGACNITYSTIVFNFDVCRLSQPISPTKYVLSIASEPFLFGHAAILPRRSVAWRDEKGLDEGDQSHSGTFQAPLIAINLRSGSIFVSLGKQNFGRKAQLRINLRT